MSQRPAFNFPKAAALIGFATLIALTPAAVDAKQKKSKDNLATEQAAPVAADTDVPVAPEESRGKSKKKSLKEARSKSAAQKSAEQAADDPSIAHPPMWIVSDDDTEIYLVGTFHVLPPGVKWRSPELGAALDQSDEIWFEAEVDTPAAQEKTRKILVEQGFNRDGRALTEILPEDSAAKLRQISERLDLPVEAVDRMRPWQAFLTLSVQFIVKKGFDPSSGLEPGLIKEARARGRHLVFLETVDQQLGFFTKLKPEVERSLLELTLSEWDEQEADFDKLFKAWRHGSTDEIDALMNEPMREKAPEVYEVLLKRRNAAWAKSLAAAMAEPGKKVVAVGAAHLAGPDSVPSILAAEGFRVSRYAVDGAQEPILVEPAIDDEPAGGANASPPDAERSPDDIESLLQSLEPADADD